MVDPVVVVQEVAREAQELELAVDRAEVAAPAEVGAREQARVGAAGRVPVWVEAVSALELVQVLEAEDLVAGVVRVAGQELAGVPELGRADRECRGSG